MEPLLRDLVALSPVQQAHDPASAFDTLVSTTGAILLAQLQDYVALRWDTADESFSLEEQELFVRFLEPIAHEACLPLLPVARELMQRRDSAGTIDRNAPHRQWSAESKIGILRFAPLSAAAVQQTVFTHEARNMLAMMNDERVSSPIVESAPKGNHAESAVTSESCQKPVEQIVTAQTSANEPQAQETVATDDCDEQETLIRKQHNAIKNLWERHQQDFNAYARTLVRDSHTAHDAVQGVAVTLLSTPRALPDDEDRLARYVLRCIHNKCMDVHRNSQLLGVDKSQLSDPRNGQRADLAYEEATKVAKYVRSLIIRLPPQERDEYISTLIDKFVPQEAIQKFYYLDQELRDRDRYTNRVAEIIKKIARQVRELHGPTNDP